jgi:hypothetical protein
MIRRHGDIAGVLRERELRDADREYLENAVKVVPPVDDLPIELPAGRRESYPADKPRMDAIAARYDVHNACMRFVGATRSLASTG